jgi:hypothetical protein
MPITKEEAIQQVGNDSHQQALVKRIMGTKTAQPVKYIIPAGRTLTEDLTSDMLRQAVYNWLCHSRHWTKAMISFAKNPQLFKTSEDRVIDFDSAARLSYWEQNGKRKTASMIADIINQTDNLVAVKIQKDGIYAITESEGRLTPDSDDWEPYVELLPFRPPQN